VIVLDQAYDMERLQEAPIHAEDVMLALGAEHFSCLALPALLGVSSESVCVPKSGSGISMLSPYSVSLPLYYN
jgi:hypothetical protein